MARSKNTENTKEAENAKPAETSYVRKMSVKTIVGKVRPFVNYDSKKPVLLATVYGCATDVKNGESEFGLWTAFIGDFEAVNNQTGEVFHSNKLYLPGAAEEILSAAVKMSDKAVEFAYEIGVTSDDDTAAGYTYVVKNLLTPQGADPLARIREEIFGNDAKSESDGG